MDAALPKMLVSFRLDPGEFSLARRYATANSISLSAVIRRGLRREIGMPEAGFLSIDVERGEARRIPHETLYGADEDEAAELVAVVAS